MPRIVAEGLLAFVISVLVVEMTELARYCSHMSNKALLGRLLRKYDRFCIVGQSASVPYIRRELARLGKAFVQARSYAPEILGQFKGRFDCLLICGSQGNYPIDVPVAAVMRASGRWIMRHIDDRELAVKSFSTSKNESPESNRDWYYVHELHRRRSAREFREVRIDATARVKRENQGRRGATRRRENAAARRAATNAAND